jgi:hypothetical protein
MKKRRRLAGLTLLAVLLLAGLAWTLHSLGVFAETTDYLPVPAGDQEIVFLAPATSADAWERLVAAVDMLERESRHAGSSKRRLDVDKTKAFVELTAEVPEVLLSVEGAGEARLRIRWYKLTGENTTNKWIAELTRRPTPPLAIVGGDSSYRALLLAKAMQKYRLQWPGQPPLLCITTATVDRYVEGDDFNADTTDERWPLLIEAYPGRTFRFSFTNARMAEVALEFVRTHDELWPAPRMPAAKAAALAGAGDPMRAAAAAGAVDLAFPPCLHNVKWLDDSFARDLADRFQNLFPIKFPGAHLNPTSIDYSVGDIYQPNPSEADVVGKRLLTEVKQMRDRRQLLLLPASVERARRFLRALVRRATPLDLENLIVLTGDAVGFTTIYRDRDVAWNIQDMPVPLVLFTHRNPVEEAAGFKPLGTGAPTASATGTEDLLLYRDIFEALLLTAYHGQALTALADDVKSGLQQLCWKDTRVVLPGPGTDLRLFQGSGNRSDNTGEHIIVLQPELHEGGTLVGATITVWRIGEHPDPAANWVRVRTLDVEFEGNPQRPKDNE